MHNKYKDINIKRYKSNLRDAGEALKKSGLTAEYLLTIQEYRNVEAYEQSLVAPWDKLH